MITHFYHSFVSISADSGYWINILAKIVTIVQIGEWHNRTNAHCVNAVRVHVTKFWIFKWFWSLHDRVIHDHYSGAKMSKIVIIVKWCACDLNETNWHGIKLI